MTVSRSPEYRIEDLAHHSGASVRTVRAYQDRGLLPRPRRRGRANVYDDGHLARLRQIAALLERGYTLASIKELLEAWDSGRGLAGVLGLVAEVEGPWTDESPEHVTRAELSRRFGRPQPPNATPRAPAPGGAGTGRHPGAEAEDGAGAGADAGSATNAGAGVPSRRGGEPGGQPGQGVPPGHPGAEDGTARGRHPGAGRSAEPSSCAEAGAAGGAGGGSGSVGGAAGGAEGGSGSVGGAEAGNSAGDAADQGVEEAIAEAVALGVLVPVAGDADTYLVPSPQELAVAAELHAAGVPLPAITGHLRELRGRVEQIATRFLDFTTEHVFARYLGHPPTEAEASEAAELVRRLRPLAQQSVDAELARAMRTLAARHLRHHLSATTPAAPTGAPVAPAASARTGPGPRVGPDERGPVPVPLPSDTVRAVTALVGADAVAAFITAATNREVAARSMDRLAAHCPDGPDASRPRF